MAAPNTLRITGISRVGIAGHGDFKMNPSLLGWQCTTSGQEQSGKLQLPGTELVAAEWYPIGGKNCSQLKLVFSGDAGSERFSGFQDKDFASLKAFLKTHFRKDLVKHEVSTEGWNFGDVSWSHSDLRVNVNGKLGFELPVANLSSSIGTIGTNDLHIEYVADPVALRGGEEMLAEVRLFAPNKTGDCSAEALRDALQSKTGSALQEKAICVFHQVFFGNPRGKFDVSFHSDGLHLHGKSATHILSYSHIGKLFLLDVGALGPQGAKQAIVLGLSQALKQGQTLHSWLVMYFDDKIMPPDQVPPEMKKVQSEYRVDILMTKLLMEKTEKKAVGSMQEFKDKHPQNHACLVTAYKTEKGMLFLGKMSFIFITKPVIWKKWKDVAHVAFSSGMTHSRTFDMTIHMGSGPPFEFKQIDKGSLQVTMDCLATLNVATQGAAEVLQRDQAATERQRNLNSRLEGSPGKGAIPPGDGDFDPEEEDKDWEDQSDDGSSSGASLEEEEAPRKKQKRS